MGRVLLAAVHVEFDEESVGRGGAGFAWPQHSGLEEQALHLPKHTLGSHTSESDQESAHDRDHDHAELDDHEVSRILRSWERQVWLLGVSTADLTDYLVLSCLVEDFGMSCDVCYDIFHTGVT